MRSTATTARALTLSTLFVVATSLPAQAAGAPADSLFLRAQRMVAEGEGDAGRALVEERLQHAAPGSPEYAEALYWRGVVAATAADAERDLRRLVVEWPLAPRAGEALLRLAQLEGARGERVGAMRHLERVVLEHPASPARARASFTLARLHFDERATAKGCAQLDDAALSAGDGDVELRNQIDYYRHRCAGVQVAAATNPPAGAPPPTTESTATALPEHHPTRVADSIPTRTPPPVVLPAASPSGAPGSPPVPPPARPAGASRATTMVPPLSVVPPVPMSQPPRNLPRAGVAAAPPSTRYSVQVAAFRSHAQADRERARLAARGYDVRVVGDAAGGMWRVRVGSYPSREAAGAAQRRMQAKQVRGIVVEAERR
ncbi:MAG: SPOR domain-containing protein [Gemmatimonadaceae bacterium]